MTVALTEAKDVIIISMEYDPTGLVWVKLYDNHALGWLVDETTPIGTAAALQADPKAPPVTTGAHEPFPIILGSLPVKVAVDTAPVRSPQWAKFVNPAVLIPDGERLALTEFFGWIATNNGAQRQVAALFAVDSTLMKVFNEWAWNNGDLVFYV